MSALLLSLPYSPNIFWLQNFVKHNSVIVEQEENFVKSSFRNRCEIAGANGKQLLTIPIIGGRDHHQLYKEVKIANTGNWQKKHWQSIRSAYGSAPYFEFYAHKFEPLYNTEFELLFEFNKELLNATLTALKLNKPFEFTSVYKKEPTGAVDLRNDKQANSSTKYYQVFAERNGFISNLCAFDLIFNEGNRSGEVIAPSRLF